MSDLDPSSVPPSPSSWRERVDLLTTTVGGRPSTRQAIGAALLVAVLAIVGWVLLRPAGGPPVETGLPLASATSPPSSVATSTTAGEVVVHVAGAVTSPGVYRLPVGARVADVVDAAGGPTVDADVDQLNLAAVVTDGERVYVPRVGEAVPVSQPTAAVAPSGPLDLNSATLEQLDALPGVGPATAKAIIEERERRGGFRSVEDLLDVRGIGPAKLDALRDLVRVG